MWLVLNTLYLYVDCIKMSELIIMLQETPYIEFYDIKPNLKYPNLK